MTKPALLAVLALTLAGCSTAAQWQKPNVSEAQMSEDMRACRGAALSRARDSASPLASPSWNTSGDMLEQDRVRDRLETERQRESVVEARSYDDCMGGHGYSRVAP